MPDEEKVHEEEPEQKPDIESMKVSVKSLWKIILAVVAIVSAWVGTQFTIKHVHDEVTALQKQREESLVKWQNAGAEHTAVHRTLCQALAELGEVTHASYYVAPENMTLWAISTQVQVAPNILQRYNKIEDPNLIKKGTIIKYPSSFGMAPIPSETTDQPVEATPNH